MVTLTGSDGSSLSTLTDANGDYEFDNLTLLVSYIVSMTPPAGMAATAYEQGNDPSVYSALYPTTDTIAPFTLTAFQPSATIDAGFITTSGGAASGDSALGGFVSTGGSPSGVSGVTVQLFDANNAYLGATLTDPTGAYSFANIAVG